MQREILGVLVRTLEEDHTFIDDLVKEEALKSILEVQKNYEFKCNEIAENCRLGLAILGYCKPLETEYLRVLSIDGGGIRGILVIELMKRLEEITGRSVSFS